MSSQLRLETSRANGAKSCGPVTVEGKARSSKNALKHGFCSEQILMPGESQQEFDLHTQTFLDQFRPTSAFERTLVHDMAAAEWQLDRARAIENQLLRYGAEDWEPSESSPIDPVTGGFTRLARSPSFEAIGRHQTRLIRRYSRSLTALLKCRKDRSALAAGEQPGLTCPAISSPPTRETNPDPLPVPGPQTTPTPELSQNGENEPTPRTNPEPPSVSKPIQADYVNGSHMLYTVEDSSQAIGFRFIDPGDVPEQYRLRS